MDKKVCGKFPKVCYKAFECKEYAESFMDRGIFRMGCQLSYTAIEDKSRCDLTEGRGHTKEPGIVTYYGYTQNPKEKPAIVQKSGYQDHDIEQRNPKYCFCTCLREVKRAHMSKNFGEYIVRIGDPRQLAEDINDYFISKEQNFLIVGCRVVYNKGQKLEKELTVNERLKMPYKQKPESFGPDCEFRILAIKLSESCKGECKFLDGQFEQADPVCRFRSVNLGKQLNYTQLCES